MLLMMAKICIDDYVIVVARLFFLCRLHYKYIINLLSNFKTIQVNESAAAQWQNTYGLAYEILVLNTAFL